MENLYRRFIRLVHVIREELFLQASAEGPEIVLINPDDPVREILFGDLDSIRLELCRDPFIRKAKGILSVDDGSDQRRRRNAVFDRVRRTVTAEEFILMQSAGSDVDLYHVVFDNLLGRNIAHPHVGLILEVPPVSFSEVTVQFFPGHVVRRDGLMLEILQILCPAAWLLLPFRFCRKDLFCRRLRNRRIGKDFRFIEKAHLSCNLVEFLCVAPESLLLEDTELLHELLIVLLQ